MRSLGRNQAVRVVKGGQFVKIAGQIGDRAVACIDRYRNAVCWEEVSVDLLTEYKVVLSRAVLGACCSGLIERTGLILVRPQAAEEGFGCFLGSGQRNRSFKCLIRPVRTKYVLDFAGLGVYRDIAMVQIVFRLLRVAQMAVYRAVLGVNGIAARRQGIIGQSEFFPGAYLAVQCFLGQNAFYLGNASLFGLGQTAVSGGFGCRIRAARGAHLVIEFAGLLGQIDGLTGLRIDIEVVGCVGNIAQRSGFAVIIQYVFKTQCLLLSKECCGLVVGLFVDSGVSTQTERCRIDRGADIAGVAVGAREAEQLTGIRIYGRRYTDGRGQTVQVKFGRKRVIGRRERGCPVGFAQLGAFMLSEHLIDKGLCGFLRILTGDRRKTGQLAAGGRGLIARIILIAVDDAVLTGGYGERGLVGSRPVKLPHRTQGIFLKLAVKGCVRVVQFEDVFHRLGDLG